MEETELLLGQPLWHVTSHFSSLSLCSKPMCLRAKKFLKKNVKECIMAIFHHDRLNQSQLFNRGLSTHFMCPGNNSHVNIHYASKVISISLFQNEKSLLEYTTHICYIENGTVFFSIQRRHGKALSGLVY